jgi:uncharacterized protein (DUF2235 family)
MKRLTFCFDGTWNRLDAPCPTNVVLTAQSIIPVTSDGTTQIIHYDEGVGTGQGEKLEGGLFGHGLLTNIADAYRFLIFNYDVGDEVYVFGFSRGAYTARSFVGMLRTCGILRRENANQITEAVELYKNRSSDENHSSLKFREFRWKNSRHLCMDADEDTWRCETYPNEYQAGQSPIFRIRYLGVWDTVGSLGIPRNMFIAPLINKKYEFHDTHLSSMVTSARHAVAIDEKRRSFSPTLWDNFDELNGKLGFDPRDDDAPYHQKWFPGTHGSVGGGGDITGLSDEAMDWVISGARKMGLQLDTTEASAIFRLQPDHRVPLDNVKAKKSFSLLSFGMNHLLPKADRTPRPATIEEVSLSARARWSERAEDLPEKELYRPPTLNKIKADLDRARVTMPPRTQRPTVQKATPAVIGTPSNFYTVKRGDTLTGISQAHYGTSGRYMEIFEANRGMLLNPDRIYPGQVLRIPMG